MNPEQIRPISFDFFGSYDPQIRASETEIGESVRALARHPVVSAILDSANAEMIVVNAELQIVAANRGILEKVGSFDSSSVVGRRLGELVSCDNAVPDETCCGGSEGCATCGATGSVLTSMNSGQVVEGECVITANLDDSRSVLEYAVRATPITVSGLDFTVVSLQDISDKKRRAALERVFIHDLNNTLSALIGWSEELVTESEGELVPTASNVNRLVKRLTREVDYHRILTAVESEDFKPRVQSIFPSDVLVHIESVFEKFASSRKQSIVIEQPVANLPCETDPVLLERVLINMVKNALEAEDGGGSVSLGCVEEDDHLRFFVSNATPIPEDIKPRIFERSFSTKNENGRGLGTYSMKLFGERVLGGRVWFESDQERGTTFFLELPAN